VNTLKAGIFCIAALSVLVAGGCASVLAPSDLRVSIAVERAFVSPGSPTLIHVTATNAGERPVSWGPGSSSCQLHLVVRVDGQEQFAPSPRVCTADSRMYTLRPGESRTESLEWEGLVQRGTAVVHLEPGTYEVRGAAGRLVMSETVLVEIRTGSSGTAASPTGTSASSRIYGMTSTATGVRLQPASRPSPKNRLLRSLWREPGRGLP